MGGKCCLRPFPPKGGPPFGKKPQEGPFPPFSPRGFPLPPPKRGLLKSPPPPQRRIFWKEGPPPFWGPREKTRRGGKSPGKAFPKKFGARPALAKFPKPLSPNISPPLLGPKRALGVPPPFWGAFPFPQEAPHPKNFPPPLWVSPNKPPKRGGPQKRFPPRGKNPLPLNFPPSFGTPQGGPPWAPKPFRFPDFAGAPLYPRFSQSQICGAPQNNSPGHNFREVPFRCPKGPARGQGTTALIQPLRSFCSKVRNPRSKGIKRYSFGHPA